MEKFNSLTLKHQLFIKKYVEFCFNQTKAYKFVFDCEWDAASTSSSRLLSDAKILEGLKEYLDSYYANEGNQLEHNILKMYQLRAFYNPHDIVDQQGYLKAKMEDLGDLTYCIDGFDFQISKDGEEFCKPKLANREKALDKLCQMTEKLRDKITVTGQIVYLPESAKSL